MPTRTDSLLCAMVLRCADNVAHVERGQANSRPSPANYCTMLIDRLALRCLRKAPLSASVLAARCPVLTPHNPLQPTSC
eukprot:1095941-Rhodomonas_salina.2